MVQADKYFKHLLADGIYFYDEKKNVPTRRRRAERERVLRETRRKRYWGFLHYEF
jgi:hypothetical protein